MLRHCRIVLGVLCLAFPGVPFASATALYNVTDLGTLPGDTSSYGWRINASGQVVGVCQTSTGDDRAFLYSNGAMTYLGTLPGYLYSKATGINDNGQVVGWATNVANTSGDDCARFSLRHIDFYIYKSRCSASQWKV